MFCEVSTLKNLRFIKLYKHSGKKHCLHFYITEWTELIKWRFSGWYVINNYISQYPCSRITRLYSFSYRCPKFPTTHDPHYQVCRSVTPYLYKGQSHILTNTLIDFLAKSWFHSHVFIWNMKIPPAAGYLIAAETFKSSEKSDSDIVIEHVRLQTLNIWMRPYFDKCVICSRSKSTDVQ